ncbi:MAG: hypothetical protein ACYSUI_21435 [Planctomycetota bacterium]|jgi:hypothetical protein
MWPFSRKPRPREDWEPRVEKLERGLRDLKTDWDEVYEKFARLNARLAKRIKDEEKKAQVAAGETNGDHPDTTNPPKNPLAARLLNPYGVK